MPLMSTILHVGFLFYIGKLDEFWSQYSRWTDNRIIHKVLRFYYILQNFASEIYCAVVDVKK